LESFKQNFCTGENFIGVLQNNCEMSFRLGFESSFYLGAKKLFYFIEKDLRPTLTVSRKVIRQRKMTRV
jgi:hypothetical protein